jgi:hypothetical protein
MLKPKLAPPLEKNIEVGIDVDGMGIMMLGILTYGEDDTNNIPKIEGPKENGMDGVGPMEIRGGNIDITEILPWVFPAIQIQDGIIVSTTLDVTIVLDMVGGWINKYKGALKISLTWKSRGAFGSVKGGLKFCGGCSYTTSTSTKPFSLNQISSPSRPSSKISSRLIGGCASVMGSSPRSRRNRCGISAIVNVLL